MDRAFRYSLLLLAALVPLCFLHSPGTEDVLLWTNWMRDLDAYGPVGGYEAIGRGYPSVAVNPPLGVSVLALVAEAAEPYRFLAFKGTLYFFLLLGGGMVLAWRRDALIASFFFLSFTLNATALGYFDVYTAPTLLAGFWALREKRLVLSAVFFALSSMTKWQPLVVLPFVAVYLMDAKALPSRAAAFKRAALRFAAPCAAVFALVAAVFGYEVFRSFQRGVSHNMLSGHALNFNWALTWFLHLFSPAEFGPLDRGLARLIRTSDPWITLPPKVAFAASYLVLLAVFFRREKTYENLLMFSLAGSLAYFTFNTGVHENHLFVPSLLGLLLLQADNRHLALALLLALCANLNLLLFYGLDGNGFDYRRVLGVDATLILALLYTALFFAVFVHALRTGRAKRSEPEP